MDTGGGLNLDPLFSHIAAGGLLQAWYSYFEYCIWTYVCIPRYGWPELPLNQLRCAMAKSRAFGLPGSLAAAGDVLQASVTKDKEGKRLLQKFSVPRKPTRKDDRRRILPAGDPEDAAKLYLYNIQDLEAEAEISSRVPDLIPNELEFWLRDQAINVRGVQMDTKAIRDCLTVIEQAHVYYNSKLAEITGGEVKYASEIQRFRKWLMGYGVHAETLDSETVAELLKIESLPDECLQALKIREMLGSAAVKKLYAMINTTTSKGRIHDLFIYHSARTGRHAGVGVQPQNLPNHGDPVSLCVNPACQKHFTAALGTLYCPWCGHYNNHKIVEWNPQAVENALTVIATKNLDCVEYFFGNAISTISGCLRGLFISAPGHDLICSDYSAIEAVVLAALSGEDWRLEVFRTHGKIYEMSASKVCGLSFDDFLLYKSVNGQHHPKRKLGKVAELASGYQGWLGAWKAFGADEFLSDDQIKDAILAWRDASPKIVEFWGGQPNWKRRDYYGVEGAAIQAVLNPGHKFEHRGISYFVNRNVLYCQLLSGRYIAYHKPELHPSDRRPGTDELTFEGWNTNPNNGAIGWVRMPTYGGKLTENVVQATARDILAHAIISLERAGYPVVLHVHDEIVVEVPEGHGSVEEVERTMSSVPDWAEGWPIKASGGWRGKRYTK